MDVAEFVEIVTEPAQNLIAETDGGSASARWGTAGQLAGVSGTQPAFVAPAGECQFGKQNGGKRRRLSGLSQKICGSQNTI